MTWLTAIVLIGLACFTAYLRYRVDKLQEALLAQEKQLATQQATLASHTGMLASHKDILDAHKDLLASYKDTLNGLKAEISVWPAPPEAAESLTNEDDASVSVTVQRSKMAEEKARFEREVQEKNKNMDWYEKEFSIALDALLELFLHVPRPVREAIISAMPNSVIKKGFKRLSDEC
ncbi:MAG: hypothetical protein JRI36_10375 [Deltaproteobacteria bacterium]|nr:hypothetical protein [Deltaproteobacteria bacterium]